MVQTKHSRTVPAIASIVLLSIGGIAAVVADSSSSLMSPPVISSSMKMLKSLKEQARADYAEERAWLALPGKCPILLARLVPPEEYSEPPIRPTVHPSTITHPAIIHR